MSTGQSTTAFTAWSLINGNARVGVPADIEGGSFEWRSVVERLSATMQAEPADVAFRIMHEHLDEALLRAANDELIADSIPLVAGRWWTPPTGCCARSRRQRVGRRRTSAATCPTETGSTSSHGWATPGVVLT